MPTEYFKILEIDHVNSENKIEMANVIQATAEWIKATSNKRLQLTLIVELSR